MSDYGKALNDLLARGLISEAKARAMAEETAKLCRILQNEPVRQVEASRPKAKSPARRRRRMVRPADGLLTEAEAAARLRCSRKTLRGHIASGALRYVVIGHGKRRPRKMFTDADLIDFIATQTRKDFPCPSDATRARRIGNTTFKSEVIAFSDRPNARPGVKRKP